MAKLCSGRKSLLSLIRSAMSEIIHHRYKEQDRESLYSHLRSIERGILHIHHNSIWALVPWNLGTPRYRLAGSNTIYIETPLESLRDREYECLLLQEEIQNLKEEQVKLQELLSARYKKYE
jgi:hypothetical protein